MNFHRRSILFLLAPVALAMLAWHYLGSNQSNENVLGGNGRIEAVEIDVATKTPGRLSELLVREGEFVTAGQLLAVMDTQGLQAQLQQAQAQERQTEDAVATATSQLAQRESEKLAAEALVAQRAAELDAAQRRALRITELARRGASSQQEADDAAAVVNGATAAVSAARAQVAASEAAITTARSQINSAQSAVAAAQAAVSRLQTELDDSRLAAPRAGRVQYIVARAGEVLGAGGRVLNLVDVTDVYMTFFLPTAIVGRLELGSEVRIVLDAAPEYVIPATLSFIADEAQFTPKTVETASEREKLMFRVRAQISHELLEQHLAQVKTGLPGMAWVRIDATAPWPQRLNQNLVE